MLYHAPRARLLSAQAFGPAARAEAPAVAAALRWLAERARVVNFSLGLAHDREDPAHDTGPGRAVFPAAYPGVLRVTGDARCQPGELSALGGTPADYGACVRGVDGTPGGASLAAARVTGLLAAGLAASGTDATAILSPAVRFRGRERWMRWRR